MADDSYQEKTEPASEKKRQEARDKGHVARSVELNSAAVLLSGLLILYVGGAALAGGIAEVSRSVFAGAGLAVVSPEAVHSMFTQHLLRLAMLLGPMILGIMLTGLAVNAAQVGLHMSGEAIRPKFAKLNPVTGVRKLLMNRRSLMELLKGIVKVLIVGLIAYSGLKDAMLESPALVESDPHQILAFVAGAALSVSLRASLAYLVLASLDYAYQRFEYEKDLRMSKEEVKEETKTLEGDPLVKSRIRSIQRRIAYRRMMADVPEADVVVTNPTHYAVAVRYEADRMSAPRVVAKGANLVAMKIRELALEHGVPIVEDKPLAQALYRGVEVGEEIPEKLFQAVAQLLAYIYRMRQEQPQPTMT